MSKYELSISPSYAQQWTIVDAVREIFQNAIDQQTTQADNAMFWHYDEEKEVLEIGNHSSVLQVRSLLLGESTKQDDASTIGKFGEGYKIATLVLLREGKQIRFVNYGANEVWKPRFVDSRRYGAKVLTFFVDKKPIWTTLPDHNLTIMIFGITADEYESIVESNLHLQEVEQVLQTNYGRILFDERHKGKVFVNGLWVCDYEDYHYGYDFKPAHIKIDRDRKLVSDWDLKWLSSTMWNFVDGENDRLMELIRTGAADVAYLDSTSYKANSTRVAAMRNVAYDSFVREYGPKAVPVTTQSDMQNVPSTHLAVIVPDNYKQLVTKSSKYKAPQPPKPKTKPIDALAIWFEGVRDRLLGDEVAQFEKTYDLLKEELTDAYDQIL